LEIGKLIQALTAQGFEIPKDTRPRAIVSSKFRKASIDAIEELREAGVVASLEITKRCKEKIVEYGKLTQSDYVVSVDSSLDAPVTVFDLKSGKSRSIAFETFLKELGAKQ